MTGLAILLLFAVFVAAVNVYLPSNNRRDAQTDRQTDRLMEEAGSAAMTYLPSFMKTGSGIPRSKRGKSDTQTR
jgi:hypothetical protein